MAKTFVGQDAKAEVARAIGEVEAQTSAEIVVAVRPSAGHYRHTDYLVGFALSFAVLLVFLFDSHEFTIDTMPLETLAAFMLGAVLSANVPLLRRALTSRRLMVNNARTAARAAFVDLGIAKTHGRTGLLVFVAMFERRVEVVLDSGIDTALFGVGYTDALSALHASVRGRPDAARFVAALRSLGPVFAKVLPRAADDRNELPDEVAQA
jgi:putative membrane protein